MPALNSSNILFNRPFNTNYDFTVSFTYTMSAGSSTPVQNNGFSIFFIDGSYQMLAGGGSGAGLGIISSTDTSPLSSVNGFFAGIGFDIQGTWCRNSSPFTTGNATAVPYSLGLRVTPDFTFVSSVVPLDRTIMYPYNLVNTVRLSVRNNFRSITIDKLSSNGSYNKITTFDSSILPNIGRLPATGKFGIGFSGDTIFNVQDISLNYA